MNMRMRRTTWVRTPPIHAGWSDDPTQTNRSSAAVSSMAMLLVPSLNPWRLRGVGSRWPPLAVRPNPTCVQRTTTTTATEPGQVAHGVEATTGRPRTPGRRCRRPTGAGPGCPSATPGFLGERGGAHPGQPETGPGRPARTASARGRPSRSAGPPAARWPRRCPRAAPRAALRRGRPAGPASCPRSPTSTSEAVLGRPRRARRHVHGREEQPVLHRRRDPRLMLAVEGDAAGSAGPASLSRACPIAMPPATAPAAPTSPAAPRKARRLTREPSSCAAIARRSCARVHDQGSHLGQGSASESTTCASVRTSCLVRVV